MRAMSLCLVISLFAIVPWCRAADLEAAKALSAQIARCYAAGKAGDALPLFKQIIPVFEKAGDNQALLATLINYQKLLQSLGKTNTADYAALSKRISVLKNPPPIRDFKLTTRDLVGKRFAELAGAGGYFDFIDEESVDIRSHYSKYNGVSLDGKIAGTYSIINTAGNPQIRIKYTFNGVACVATYYTTRKGSAIELLGGSDPLPIIAVSEP